MKIISYGLKSVDVKKVGLSCSHSQRTDGAE